MKVGAGLAEQGRSGAARHVDSWGGQGKACGMAAGWLLPTAAACLCCFLWSPTTHAHCCFASVFDCIPPHSPRSSPSSFSSHQSCASTSQPSLPGAGACCCACCPPARSCCDRASSASNSGAASWRSRAQYSCAWVGGVLSRHDCQWVRGGDGGVWVAGGGLRPSTPSAFRGSSPHSPGFFAGANGEWSFTHVCSVSNLPCGVGLCETGHE